MPERPQIWLVTHHDEHASWRCIEPITDPAYEAHR